MKNKNKNKKIYFIAPLFSCLLIILGVHSVYAFSASVYGSSYTFEDSGTETGIIPNDPDTNKSYRISDAGDVNNDGYNDILIGIPGILYGNGSGYGGAAYLLYGSEAGFSNINLATAVKFSSAGTGYNGYGAAVAGLGDINNDGFDDFAIAATGDFGVQRVHVYFGKAEEYTSQSIEPADSIITVGGNFESWRFGTAISAAGDINNDGFDDMMIGSPFSFDDQGQMIGSTYIVFGRSTWDQDFVLENDSQPLASNVVKIIGDDAAQIYNFGYALSGKADIDADGKNDIVIGAPNISDDTYNGSVFVIYGKDISPTAGTVAITSLTNRKIVDNSTGSGLGMSVAFEGDIDGSGTNDLVIGAPYYINPTTQSGATYILYDDVLSGITENTTHTVTVSTPHFLGEASADQLGIVLGQGGDINNDGYDDITMLKGYYNNQSAYIAYGSATQRSGEIVLSDATHAANSVVEYSGVTIYSLTIVQHTNNDNFDDLILYTGYEPSLSVSGSVLYIAGSNTLSGTNTLPDTVTARFDAEPSVEYLGQAVADGGDINNDGATDFIVGAPYDYGKTFFVYGVPNMSATNGNIEQQVVFLGEQSDDQSGFAVAGGQDITNDNFDDSVITAPYSDRGATDAGAVYIIFGGSSIENMQLQNADKIITDTTAGTHFGWSTKYIPNLDGDTIPDLVISAPDDGSGNGAIYIFYGSTLNAAATTLTTAQADIVIHGQGAEAAGTALAVLPDMDGDSKEELMIGAPAADSSTGKAYVMYSSTMINTLNPTTSDADITFVGEAVGDEAGFSVAPAGDINLDGFEDLLIGAPESTSTQGKGYIVYGRDNFAATVNLSTANYIFTGAASSSKAGFSVLGYDADEDGYSDVVMSAPASTGSGIPDPKTFFIHGQELDPDISHSTSLELNSTNAAELVGGVGNDQLGWSTAVVPDMNGMHHPMLLVGAPCNLFTQTCDPVVYGLYLYTDIDQDTYNGSQYTGFPYATDCNDYVDTINPGAAEICDDVDNNCDGQNNEGLPTYTAYPDVDADAFGDMTADPTTSCVAPGYYVEDNTDCDDYTDTTYPGAPELCNAVDDDCNTLVDDGAPFTTYYHDADGDGYGDVNAPMLYCPVTVPGDYVSDSTDCNDADASIHPGATDIPDDGIDQDCSGSDAVTPVVPANQAPVFSGSLPTVSFFSGTTTVSVFNLNDYFTDPDGDALEFSVVGNSEIVVYIDPNGDVRFSAPADFTGVERMYFVATDPSDASAQSNTIPVTVSEGDPNDDGETPPPDDGEEMPDTCDDGNGIDANVGVAISHVTGTTNGKGIITVYGTNGGVIRCWQTFSGGGVIPQLGYYNGKHYVYSIKHGHGSTMHIEDIYGTTIAKKRLSNRRLHIRRISIGQLDDVSHTQEIVITIKRGSSIYIKIFSFNMKTDKIHLKRQARHRDVWKSGYSVKTKKKHIILKNRKGKTIWKWKPF